MCSFQISGQNTSKHMEVRFGFDVGKFGKSQQFGTK